MIKVNEAVHHPDGVDPKHEVEVVCANCGYDLDEGELFADTCADCGHVLNLKQSTKIYATSIPPASGTSLV